MRLSANDTPLSLARANEISVSNESDAINRIHPLRRMCQQRSWRAKQHHDRDGSCEGREC